MVAAAAAYRAARRTEDLREAFAGLADLEPRLARVFTLAVTDFSEETMVNIVEHRDYRLFERTADEVYGRAETRVRALLREAVEQAARRAPLPPGPRSSLRFDLVNPKAINFAATRSGELITAISAETRGTIRLLLRDAYGKSVV